MCSGERKPSGGEWSVVNVMTSPTPRMETGLIATGCRGQNEAGGATTSAHRGHREPAMVSII